MARRIDGTQYYSLAEVTGRVGVSRQTIWRWRREQKIPSGYRLRNRQIVFKQEELEAIKSYSKSVEPAVIKASTQMKLFKNGKNNGGNP
jgi:predicted DNA-binding transcriptional regulator AlpA